LGRGGGVKKVGHGRWVTGVLPRGRV
jgi:hypothetical protein